MSGVSLAGMQLKEYHVCAFFNSRDEEYAVLNPFFIEGSAQNEKNLHIINPAFAADHRKRLTDAGMDADHCEACGQLEVLGWDVAFLDQKGEFNKERMLAAIEQLTGTGRDAGFGRVRIMGNMDWVFQGMPGTEDILEYEAEVNEVLARNEQPAVCVYDVAKLSGAMMMDLLRTHPLTLIGGAVQENPFFTPPEEMLRELRARRQAQPVVQAPQAAPAIKA